MIASLALAAAAAATPSPQDRRNIALSTAVVERVGDSIWPGWSRTPFQIDLLTANGPVLLNVPRSFTPPAFPRDLEATLTLDTGPIVVIGEPRYVHNSAPVRWSVTLLHEHFHEWQYAWPGYETAVKALDLAGNDKTAMWMLNYAFPYTDARVDAAHAELSNRLAGALEAIRSPRFGDAVQAYLRARTAFKALLTPNDYKYFAFQCWQEGTARYTEIAVAQRAALAHSADPSFLTNRQAAALMRDANATYSGVLNRLRAVPLARDKRVDLYAVGAGEALLLDQLAPGWHERYLDPRMDLSAFFP